MQLSFFSFVLHSAICQQAHTSFAFGTSAVGIKSIRDIENYSTELLGQNLKVLKRSVRADSFKLYQWGLEQDTSVLPMAPA